MSKISLFEEIKPSTQQDIMLSTQKDLARKTEDWVYNQAIKLLAKGYSEHELKEKLHKLREKHKDAEQILDEKVHIDPAFERLRNDGLPPHDDKRVVANFIKSYPHKGFDFFARQLEKKGIAPTMITTVMKETEYPPESSRALLVARDKIDLLKQNGSSHLKDFLLILPTFLKGRGFSENSIKQTIESLEREYQNHATFKGRYVTFPPEPLMQNKDSELAECREMSFKCGG